MAPYPTLPLPKQIASFPHEDQAQTAGLYQERTLLRPFEEGKECVSRVKLTLDGHEHRSCRAGGGVGLSI